MIKLKKNVVFKNIVPFGLCISKISSTLIDNAEDLDIVMPMYSLLGYSQNYSITSGTLQNYYRDDIGDVDYNTSDGKSFKYETKIVGKTPERPEQPDPDEDGNQTKPPVPALNVKLLCHSNILAIFGDFLMYQ